MTIQAMGSTHVPGFVRLQEEAVHLTPANLIIIYLAALDLRARKVQRSFTLGLKASRKSSSTRLHEDAE
jgi:hypothetical protein